MVQGVWNGKFHGHLNIIHQDFLGMDVLTPIKIGGIGAWQSWCPETGINTFQMVRNFISVFILTSTHAPEGQSMVFIYGLWSSIPFKGESHGIFHGHPPMG